MPRRSLETLSPCCLPQYPNANWCGTCNTSGITLYAQEIPSEILTLMQIGTHERHALK